MKKEAMKGFALDLAARTGSFKRGMQGITIFPGRFTRLNLVTKNATEKHKKKTPDTEKHTRA